MENAVFSLPNPLITEKVVTAVSALPLSDRDLKGDLYEYMISKLQTAGRVGQFRTPRHIIRMMVRDGRLPRRCGLVRARALRQRAPHG